ncbi:MAG TPA: hypothetical protein VFP81_10960, partial [Propionibacteriaceae bacterium]|nr:hypothetical protein [Propionibacteriaceae bacterium]
MQQCGSGHLDVERLALPRPGTTSGLPSPAAEVVLADDREVGFLGEGDMSHRLPWTRLLADHAVTDQGSWRSLLPLECERHHGEVPVA